MLNIGDVIGDRYQILDIIGKGGMAIVYLAYDMHLQKQWAIKAYRTDKDGTSNDFSISALEKEADLMRRLDHPRIPHIIDRVIENNEFYIVMDYIEGHSLEDVMKNCGRLAQEQAIEWALQICEILDYFHSQPQPIIYRDLKPSNVMLKTDGSVCLIDLGIARVHKYGKTEDTGILGTRGYAAPEQFGGHGQTDARTDIFALGRLMFYFVTGKSPTENPYDVQPIRQLDPNLSPELEAIISQCVEKEPINRIQTVKDLMYRLSSVQLYPKDNNKLLFALIPSGAVVTMLTLVLIVTLALKNTDKTNAVPVSGQLDDTGTSTELMETLDSGKNDELHYNNSNDMSSEKEQGESSKDNNSVSGDQSSNSQPSSSQASSEQSSNVQSADSKTSVPSSGSQGGQSKPTPSSKPSSGNTASSKPVSEGTASKEQAPQKEETAAPNTSKSASVSSSFGTITLTSDKTYYNVGETITVTVKMNLDEPASSFSRMNIMFNTSLLKLTSGTGCSANTTGRVAISQDLGGSKSWSGTYKFTAKAAGAAAEISVSNATVEFIDTNKSKIFSQKCAVEVAIK